MSEWISLKEFKGSGGRRLPLNAIIYRTVNKSKASGKKRVDILIPRQISTKIGIDVNTEVDILYNPDQKIMKIVPLKEPGGFNVRAYKNYAKSKKPISKAVISFGYTPETNLPLTDNKNIYIKKFEINQGLIFSLDEKQ
jgi:hypothetical protein